MIERISRLEFENPVPVNVVLFGGIALAWFATGAGPLAFGWLALAPIRIWGLRPGGHLRRRLARKYEWASDDR